MFFTITTEAFKARFDEGVEVISVKGDVIYIYSAAQLKTPYESIEELPELVQNEWTERINGAYESKTAEVESAYKATLAEGITLDGMRFACDAEGKQAVMFASLFGGSIKAADGTAQTLTKSQITALGKAIGARIEELVTWRDAEFAAISELKSVDEIMNYRVKEIANG